MIGLSICILTNLLFTFGNGISSDSPSTDAISFFKDDPARLFETVSSTGRMEMVAYYESGINKEVETVFGSKAQILNASPEFVKVQLSPNVTIDLWVPKSKNSNFVLVNTTYNMPARDGKLSAYDSNGHLLSADVTGSLLREFATAKDKKISADMLNDIVTDADIPVTYFTIDTLKQTIVAHQNLKEFMSREQYGKIGKHFADSIVLKVDAKRGRLIKSK